MIYDANKISSQGIPYFRYLLSWVEAGGDFNSYHYWQKSEESNKWKGSHGFRKWIDTLPLDEEEKREIRVLSGMGKLELESSVRDFFKKMGS